MSILYQIYKTSSFLSAPNDPTGVTSALTADTKDVATCGRRVTILENCFVGLFISHASYVFFLLFAGIFSQTLH